MPGGRRRSQKWGRGRGERFRHLARIAMIRQASSGCGVPLHLGKELFDFIRNREAKKEAVAVAVHPEGWGEAQLRAPGKGPGDDRSGVMGCVVEAKAVAITETAVHFSAPSEALAAEGAGLRRGGGGQDAASAYGVAELPGCVGKVFFSEEVFRDVPAFEVTGENQFEFGLSFLPVAAVTAEEIGAAVVAYDLEQSLVCAVNVGEFLASTGSIPSSTYHIRSEHAVHRFPLGESHSHAR
jgi:hypothetical protein